jgi:hypothetical protein
MHSTPMVSTGLNVGFIFVLAIAAILIVSAIIAVAVLLGKKRKAGGVLAGVVLGAGALGVIVVLSIGLLIVVASNTTVFHANKQAPLSTQPYRGPEKPSPPERALVAVPPQAPPSTGITIAGTPWTNAVEEFQDFEADVYPSIEAAAEALGRRVGTRLMETSDSSDTDKRSIYVWLDEDLGEISRDVLEAVATGLRQKLNGPAYVSVERPASKHAIAVGLAVQEIQPDQHSRWGRRTESLSGAIALRVKTPAGPFSVSTRFVDAPWVVDRTSFATQYAQGDWLVAYSTGTHLTQDEARQSALAAASESLLPLARARINQLSASDQDNFRKQMQKNPDWLRGHISDELSSSNRVTDRFAQRFDRSYDAAIWREAVLVDAAPARIESIARSLVQGIDSKITRQRTTWSSFVAMIMLVFGTYLFLNMATKGYYVFLLRLATVAGLVAAGFVMMHLF